MNDDLRSALRDLSVRAPLDLDSGRLDAAIVNGGRTRRRRRRTAQGLGVCAVATAVSVVGVQFSGHQTAHRPIATGCASIPKSGVSGLIANLTVDKPVGDNLSATAKFTAQESLEVSVRGPYSTAYVIDSSGNAVAHAEPPLILDPMPPHQTFQAQPGQGYLIDTSVAGFVTCGGGKLSSLPAGRYRLVVAYVVTAAIAGASPPSAVQPRLLVSRPGEFTIP